MLGGLEKAVADSQERIEEIEREYFEKFKEVKIEIRAINMKMDRVLKDSDETFGREEKLNEMLLELQRRYTALEERIEMSLVKDEIGNKL